MNRIKYGLVSGYIGIALNITLFIIKMIFATSSKSISMQADAYNNLMDIMSSLLVVLGFKWANTRADKEHPFGHGRMEEIAGLIISVIIVFTAYEMIKSSIERIANPSAISSSTMLYLVLILSISAKLIISTFNFIIGKKIYSDTLTINAKDSASDVIATLAVLISVIAHDKWNILIDGWAGLIVSIMILYAGLQACHTITKTLLGEGLSDSDRLKISAYLINQEDIVSVHDLALHRYGVQKSLLTLHAEMDGKMTIKDMHPIVDRIEKNIHERFGFKALIHVEPCNITYNDIQNSIIATLKEALHKSAMNLFYTDFICDTDGKHMHCDVYAPYDLAIDNSEIKNMLESFILQRHKTDVNISIYRQ